MRDPAGRDIPWGRDPILMEERGVIRDEFGSYRMVCGRCTSCHGQIVASTADVKRLRCGCGGSVRIVSSAEVRADLEVRKAARR